MARMQNAKCLEFVFFLSWTIRFLFFRSSVDGKMVASFPLPYRPLERFLPSWRRCPLILFMRVNLIEVGCADTWLCEGSGCRDDGN